MNCIVRLIQLTLVLAQFINLPTAFDPSSTFIVPLGTSVVEFRSSDSAPKIPEITRDSPKAISPSSSKKTRISSVGLSNDNSDTALEASSSDRSLAAAVTTSMPFNSNDVVVTDIESYFVTVPCTTTKSSQPTELPTYELPPLTTLALSTPSVKSTSGLSTSSRYIFTPAKPSSSSCDVQYSTVYSTVIDHHTVTHDLTTFITERITSTITV